MKNIDREYLLKVLDKLAKVFKTEKFVEIETCHLSGISYLNIRDPGLEYLHDLSIQELKVKVFTTCNPMMLNFEELKNCNEDFCIKQLKIINYLKRLGVSTWFTCTPYEFLRIKENTYHAWCESSAVAYLNSVFNARSEKLPGIFAIICAILGKVPKFGLYEYENRIPRINIRLKLKDLSYVKVGLLGKYLAQLFKDKVLYISGLKHIHEHIKSFLASYATYSPNTFVVLENITSNSRQYYNEMIKYGIEDKLTLNDYDLKELYSEVIKNLDYVDALIIGCPHLKINELTINMLINQVKKFVRRLKYLIICTSRFSTIVEIPHQYYNFKTIVLRDTCPVVSNLLKTLNVEKIATNSVKLHFYISRLFNIDCKLVDLEIGRGY